MKKIKFMGRNYKPWWIVMLGKMEDVSGIEKPHSITRRKRLVSFIYEKNNDTCEVYWG